MTAGPYRPARGPRAVIGIAGFSGSGKTTLILKLIPELAARGYRVATVKHAHHDFDTDKPGKDSYEHRAAGASEVVVSSSKRWALVHENANDGEMTLDALLARMSPADVCLVEGFKTGDHDRIEVVRPAARQPVRHASDPAIVAVATDAPLPDCKVPTLDLNDAAAVADFIVAHCRLASRLAGAR